MRRVTVLALPLALLSFTLPAPAIAQDALTVGNGVTCTTISAGVTTVSIPVYIRDVSGTPLGRDQAAGRKIQAFAFQVIPSPASAIARDGSGNMQITFSRAGLTAALSPLMENNPRSATAAAALLQFDENSSPLLFTLNNPAPGDLVGTLTVVLGARAAGGDND